MRKLAVGSFFVPRRIGGSRTVRPRPAADREFENRAQRVEASGCSLVHTRHCGGNILANNVVRTLLVVGRKVTARQTLVVRDPSAFKNRDKEVRRPIYVDVGRSLAGDSYGRIVLRKINVRELFTRSTS